MFVSSNGFDEHVTDIRLQGCLHDPEEQLIIHPSLGDASIDKLNWHDCVAVDVTVSIKRCVACTIFCYFYLVVA